MDLVIWLITPPNNMRNFLNEVKARWNFGQVIIIASHPIRDERKKIGYSLDGITVDSFIVLDELENQVEFVESFIDAHAKDIHVFGGLRNDPAPIMYRYKRKYGSEAKIVAFTEKPALRSGSAFKRIMKRVGGQVIYRYIYRRAMKTVDGLFVVGSSGIESVRKYGWTKNNLFNFMYSDNVGASSFSRETVKKPVQFLYVGRFDYEMRGLDVLMKAFDMLNCEGWHLTLVGGYGTDSNEVIKWAESKDSVSYIGAWPADSVLENMRSYDVYVCPVKEDSWNGQINMAISAGLGVISTDQAGSDELVRASNAGVVIKGGDPAELRAHIEEAICDINIVDEWKTSAREYLCRITADTVAEYFCDVLKGLYVSKSDSVSCPWL